ncbi:MAG: M61 family metallopeptidase [Gemmatimonadales bacterium]|nr:M61 family metallopeptidase [Gemmatimonadales bacterium]MBA3554417.1 M61 family metallopeptidase [Gemmatimonadales bacterium]
MRAAALSLALSLWCAAGVTPAGAQRAPAPATPPRSAPLANLRYELSFDSATAAERTIRVALSFDVAGPGPVLLSFPAWTPGAYEITNFARWVNNFAPTAGDRRLAWDKLDFDTWRVQPAGARAITVRYDYIADTLDNAMAWSRPDFVLFNGTNVLPFPEGRDFNFPATVTVKTQPGWLVATGMASGPAPGSYREGNYHDLVDKPFFVGRMDVDSMRIEDRWHRLATYPTGAMSGAPRSLLWDQIGRMVPTMSGVFQETPWDTYTTLLIFTPDVGGGSALEHGNSHVGIYNPGFIGSPVLASITAHEIFHAWNVKRLRPHDLWPYKYDEEQETTWLWVSEGITDYYADLALVRGGIIDSVEFMAMTDQKIDEVAAAPPTALEDASLSAWIGPTDGTRYLYYPKGSLAGLLLDILIRDGSDNRRSLDDVLRETYRATYRKGRGFTGRDWWDTVTRAAGGRSFAEFNARYIDGREPFPWSEVLPLAGMRLVTDTIREPTLGIATSQDSGGAIVVREVAPGSVAAEAGVKVGDAVLALGDVAIENPNFGPAYRARFGRSEGDSLPIRVRRGTEIVTLAGTVRLGQRLESRLAPAPNATGKAVRIRNGIVRGVTGR